MRHMSLVKLWKTLVALAGVSLLLMLTLPSWAQGSNWSEPINISNTANHSWFPDLTVDSQGRVHVIWCETTDIKGGREQKEQVFYTMWDGTSWSTPNDIVPPTPNIHRSAITMDRSDVLHLLFGGGSHNTRGLALYHQKAASNEAWSAGAWSAAHHMSQGDGYMGDIAVDAQGVVHAIFDGMVKVGETGSEEDAEVAVADIFYRRSVDGGRTWSPLLNLFPSPFTGSSRSQMEIDSSDTIHVTWDEGWDRLTGLGAPDYGGYTFSSDGGMTWSPVMTVTYPVTTVAQLTVGSDGQEGVMLVWRATSRDEIFYQWSSDGASSWEAPSEIPGVFARPWANPFDMYDMATDSAGHIHLVVVGRQIRDREAPLGVYHFEWDGQAWSKAERIFGGKGFPEYPKIAIGQGNQLHGVWFVRESLWFSEDEHPGPHQVWYSSSEAAAPHQVVTPLPSSTPVPPTATPHPTPTATPYPTVSLDNTGLPDGLYTEGDDVLRLAIALSPTVLLVLVVVAVRRGWFGKS